MLYVAPDRFATSPAEGFAVQYYILVGAEQRGPFSWEQLRGQPIEPETLVWHDGLGDWKQAAQVPELGTLLGPYASPAMPGDASFGMPPPALADHRRHSRFGIASFVLSLVAGLALFAMIVAAGVIGASNPDGIDENAPAIIALGIGILAGMGGHIVGLGLALAGLFERDRYKIFTMLGLCFNLLALLSIGGLMIIGMAAS
jgi:hypothetical protein